MTQIGSHTRKRPKLKWKSPELMPMICVRGERIFQGVGDHRKMTVALTELQIARPHQRSKGKQRRTRGFYVPLRAVRAFAEWRALQVGELRRKLKCERTRLEAIVDRDKRDVAMLEALRRGQELSTQTLIKRNEEFFKLKEAYNAISPTPWEYDPGVWT